MLSPLDAEKTILTHLPVLPAEDCPLEQAQGRVLRAPVVADRDLPPFDRVMMDGYALKSGDGGDASARREFHVTGMQAAGMIPLAINAGGECVEVATGATLPAGADAVVPCEEVARDGARITLNPGCAPKAGAFVHWRGADHKRGETICAAGLRVTSREIAVAAACGCLSLRVSMIPRIAVVTTGDELVDISNASPAPHQLRRSNDHALRAALVEAGYSRVECVHLRDVEHEVEARLKRIVAEHDIVITTGGVSKGRYDLLPAVLAKLGVEKKLQGVAQRPGKPLWFGVTSRGSAVFALPGNPVSSYICFQRYVIPALAHASKAPAPRPQYAKLAGGFSLASPLVNYVPVCVEETAEGGRVAHALPANTSGDLAALAGTDGLVELPPGFHEAANAGAVRYYPWA